MIGAAATLSVSERNIKLESITKERIKWREHIRCLGAAIYDAATDTTATRDERAARLERLLLVLKLRLNPTDELDIEIRHTVRKIIDANANAVDPLLRQLGDRLSLLLKHDWERCKNDAGYFPGYEDLSPTRRTNYKEYQYKDDEAEST